MKFGSGYHCRSGIREDFDSLHDMKPYVMVFVRFWRGREEELTAESAEDAERGQKYCMQKDERLRIVVCEGVKAEEREVARGWCRAIPRMGE